MKKTLLIFLVLYIILSYSSLQAQQHPLYSQYMMNDLYFNPAIAGSKGFSPILLSIHKQWIGPVRRTPSTQTLSAHTMLSNNNVGLGGIIFNDTYGPESRLGIQAIYSYHFHIDRYNKISLGLAATAFRYKLDQRYFMLTEYHDPSISYTIVSTIVPDATFGTYVYGSRYFAGVTVANMFESRLGINANIRDNTMVRHYFAMGGYKFEISRRSKFEIEPSLLLKSVEMISPQLEINLKFYYDKDYWFGSSFRTAELNRGESFVICLGFKHQQYYFGYAYDFTISELSTASYGSQEIIFGFNLGENVRRKRSFF